jgi:Ser/Thr protein kinase RdoA (MazF antagonist)
MLHTVAQQYVSVISEIVPLGNGLINDTFLVTGSESCFVLQRINGQVFPTPEKIISNLLQLNQHLKQKTQRLQLPELLKTATQQNFFQDNNGDVWRALSFIHDSECIEELENLDIAAQVGFALGHFHHLVSDLNPEQLHDTLPNFHIAPSYLQQYHDVLNLGIIFPEHPYCKTFIEQYQHLTHDLETAKQQGLLAVRVIHGDPKLNNFLFDKVRQQVMSLIDLDTVKPGLVHYDIADCLRSCCHDKQSNEFIVEICAVILENYLSEAGSFFSNHDYDYLYPAIRLLPFELGLRFYTDYLQGNHYFKVTDSNQNLQRAIEQFKLCHSIMRQEGAIKQLIASLSC